MPLTKKIVQGLEVEVSTFNCGNHRYVVFENLIWECTGSAGSGKNYTKKLSRKERGMEIERWVKGDLLKQLEYVTKPTGYINFDSLDPAYVPITEQNYFDFCNKYSAEKELRIGQAFCNKFNIYNPVLFYEIDKGKAISMIVKYISWN
jgi:hypothetical protein